MDPKPLALQRFISRCKVVDRCPPHICNSVMWSHVFSELGSRLLKRFQVLGNLDLELADGEVLKEAYSLRQLSPRMGVDMVGSLLVALPNRCPVHALTDVLKKP